MSTLNPAETVLAEARTRADEVARQYEAARKLDEEWRANRQRLVTLAAADEAAKEELQKANLSAALARVELDNLELQRAEADRLASEADARAKEAAQRREADAISARIDQLNTLAVEFNAAFAALVSKAKEFAPLERQLDHDARQTLGLTSLGTRVASPALRKAADALRSFADDPSRGVPVNVAQEPAAAISRTVRGHWWFTHGFSR